jgi:hypothetical protein
MGTKLDTQGESLNQVGQTLRALAANLISIVRGAGKPLELSRDLDALTAALGAFEGSAGRPPKAWDLAEILRVDLDPKSAPTSEEDMAERYAQHAIVQASLQLAATRLLGREAEAAEAYAELHRSLSGLEETKRKIETRRHESEAGMVAKMESHKQE